MNQQFYGWKLIAVLWVIMVLTMGFTVYGGSIMNTYMITEMHLDRKSLGIVGGAFALCMVLYSPLVGLIVHKWGARTTISVGTLISALGALAMATIVNTLVVAAIIYGLVVGCATALGGIVPSQTVAGYWFKKRVALALTIITTGAVIGGFIATPLVTKVIEAYNGNWRMGWFVVAATGAVSFCCAILFIRNKPADIGQVQDGVVEEDTPTDANDGSQPASGVYKTAEDWTFKNALRQPTFWWMLCCLAFATIVSGMVVAHGVAHFKDLGHSPGMAAIFLSSVIFSALAGKGIFAFLGDRIEPRFIWSAALIAAAIGLVLMVKATSTIELYSSAFLLGAGPSISILCMFTLAVNYFGKTAYPTLMGVTGLFLALIPAIGIVLTGMVFDHFGSYALAFYSSAALCILGGLTMPFVVPPVRALAKLQAG